VVANLFAELPSTRRAEAFTELVARPGVRIGRILSGGQATPEDASMAQSHAKWVVVLG
jgi:cupin 2 domain-containing protein